MNKTILASLLIFLSLGCAAPPQTRVYDLTVKNDASAPITIWLTKDGPPYESGWIAPEDIAIQSPKMTDKVIGGAIVPAGKSADTGPLKGQFDASTNAVLRVYAGKLSFDELLSRSRGAANRVDLKIAPGKSSFVVTGDTSAIKVTEAEPAP